MTNIELSNDYTIWFDEYVNSFVVAQPELKENLLIKAEHSKNVRDRIIDIAQDLDFSEHDMFLAEILGLFHDIGRFEQYAKYQTFSDSDSQNHAELGVKVLKEQNTFHKFSDEDKMLLYKAITYHSRAKIPEDESQRVTLFSKLIRDADKLDIWRLVTEYYMVKEDHQNSSLELGLPDSTKISAHVVQSIITREIVKKEDMKTLNDFKLLQIAWVFDLNFSFSKRYLKEKKYLDKIFNTLPQNCDIDLIKEIVYSELEVTNTAE